MPFIILFGFKSCASLDVFRSLRFCEPPCIFMSHYIYPRYCKFECEQPKIVLDRVIGDMARSGCMWADDDDCKSKFVCLFSRLF